MGLARGRAATGLAGAFPGASARAAGTGEGVLLAIPRRRPHRIPPGRRGAAPERGRGSGAGRPARSRGRGPGEFRRRLSRREPAGLPSRSRATSSPQRQEPGTPSAGRSAPASAPPSASCPGRRPAGMRRGTVTDAPGGAPIRPRPAPPGRSKREDPPPGRLRFARASGTPLAVPLQPPTTPLRKGQERPTAHRPRSRAPPVAPPRRRPLPHHPARPARSAPPATP